MTDEKLARFATPAWVDSVDAVPPEEAALMVCEDPSVITALVGALRHARAERDAARAEVERYKIANASLVPGAIVAVTDAECLRVERDAARAEVARLKTEMEAMRAVCEAAVDARRTQLDADDAMTRPEFDAERTRNRLMEAQAAQREYQAAVDAYRRTRPSGEGERR